MTDRNVKLRSGWDLFDEYCEDSVEERFELYDLYYEISTKIFDYRTERNWSQKKLAEILGVTQAMVSKLESGEYNYTIEQLWKIANKLGWKLSIGFEGPQEQYSVCYDNEAIQISETVVG